jgi:hypothetical protein
MKLFIYIGLLLFAFSCTNSTKKDFEPSKPLIDVTMNEQMEVARIAWNLAWKNDIPEDENSTPSTYLLSVEKHFDKWSSHKLISFITENNLDDYSLPSIGLSLNEDFSIIDKKGVEKWENVYGKKVISEFLIRLKEFAIETDYSSFFQSEKSEISNFCNRLKQKIDSTIWIKNYASVFPEINKVKRIVLYVDALNNFGNTELSTNDQTIKIVYPYYSDNPTELRSKPLKPVNISLDASSERAFYHELTHFMTTELTNRYFNELKPNIQCYLSEQPEKNVTMFYKNQIDETIVRAYSAFVLYKISKGKDKTVDSYLTRQIKDYKMIKKVFDLILKCDTEISSSSADRHILLLEKLKKERV